MADNLEVGTQVEVPGTPDVTQVAENTPVEVKAREMGWVPKEEYNGDETNWLDAGEFVRRQPLFEKIEKQNKELREIKRTVAQFAQHHAKVREAEYQRALAELQEKKVAAFEEGDARAIVKIDDAIRVTEKAQEQFLAEQQAQAVQETQQVVHPEFEAWTNRNPWYTTDRAMKAYADAVGADIAVTFKPDGTKPTPAEVLKEVEKRVKENFPTKFRNVNREKPGAVEGTSARGTGKESGYSPSDFERRVAEKFVKQGLYKSTDDYYKELKLLNGKS